MSEIDGAARVGIEVDAFPGMRQRYHSPPGLRLGRASLLGFDLDQGLVQPCPLAIRTLTGFRQLVRSEGISATAASGRLNLDGLIRGLGGLQQVLEVLFHLIARQLQFVSHRRDRTGLPEHIGNLLSQGHARTL